VHTPDDRHRALVQRPQHVGQFLRVSAVFLPAVVGHGAHPVQVRAGAEGLAVASQQHHAQVRVLVQAREGLGQRGDHAVVEGVAHVRAVEPDLGHMGRRPADVENRFTHGVDPLQ
jgi:hypothetical protein